MAEWIDVASMYLLIDEDEMALSVLEEAMEESEEEALSYDKSKRFSLKKYADHECLSYFRFTKAQIQRLVNVLRIPEPFKTRSLIASAEEALCILLRRLAYPNRLVDLLPMFSRSRQQISEIFNTMLDYVHTNFGHLLTDLNQPWLNKDNLQVFADAIHKKGAPLQTCWGFVDGTACGIARPSQNQKVMYSGHKRKHCMKFQGIVTPNGLFANIFGPLEGRRHDAALWAESKVIDHLQAHMNMDDGTPFVLYGDTAYPLRDHLLKPFHGAARTREQEKFDKDMSTVRIAVEWAFGKLSTLFNFLTHERNMKVLLQATGKMFIVGGLLTNFHTCLNGSEISDYFQVQPPSLESYVNRM